LANIHKLLNSPSDNTNDIITTIYKSSVQFNTDKRSILQAYLNYVIRNCPDDVTPEYVDVMCEILHNTDVSAGDLVNYFCNQLKGLNNTPPSAS
jgi:hypothetical protein